MATLRRNRGRIRCRQFAIFYRWLAPRKLLDRVEPDAQAGFLAVGSAFVNGADLGGFVEGGSNGAQRDAGVLLFAGGHSGKVFLFQRVEARLDRKSTRLNSSHLVISYA